MGLKNEKQILDLACGHGRHSHALAKKGYKVLGVDLLEDLIDYAKKEARQAGLEIEYQVADILDYRPVQKFAHILFLHNSMHYFNDDQASTLLKAAYNILEEKGSLFFDINSRDYYEAHHTDKFAFSIKEDSLVERYKFNFQTGVLNTSRTEYRNGVRKDVSLDFKIRNYQEMEKLIIESKLKIKNVYGDWDGHEFSRDSARMIFILEK